MADHQQVGLVVLKANFFRAYADTELIKQGYMPEQVKTVMGWHSVLMVFYYNKGVSEVKGINKGLLE